MVASKLPAYLVLSLVASVAADVGEDYDYYPYSDFSSSPELSIRPSGPDTRHAEDSDEWRDFRFVDYKAVPKLVRSATTAD